MIFVRLINSMSIQINSKVLQNCNSHAKTQISEKITNQGSKIHYQEENYVYVTIYVRLYNVFVVVIITFPLYNS